MNPELFLMVYDKIVLIDNYEGKGIPATKWFVVDTSTGEPEVNYPGDLISEHDSYKEGRLGWAKAIIELATP